MARTRSAWRCLWVALVLLPAIGGMHLSRAHDSTEQREGGSSAEKDFGSGLDPQLVEKGAKVYQNHCASCHGPEGEGAPDWQEPNERGELPAPPHGPEGHTWRHSDATLYRMVSEGWRDPFNETERLTMPPFEDVLTSHEIKAVITYLKTLWTPEQRAYQEAETEARGGFPPAVQAGGAKKGE